MVMDQDIRKLAGSLKASGVASSMMEAMEKAREILVGNEKTLNIMKKYTVEKEKGNEFDANRDSIERLDSQIEEINKEIASESPRMDKDIRDVKKLDEDIKSNDNDILDEINKISSIISGTKFDNLDLPPASPEFGQGKSLNELYSEHATDEQSKEVVIDEAPVPTEIVEEVANSNISAEQNVEEGNLPEETEIVVDSAEATSVEEAPINSAETQNTADTIEITEDIGSIQDANAQQPGEPDPNYEDTQTVDEIESGLNEQLLQNEAERQKTEFHEINADNVPDAESLENMDSLIEDTPAETEEDRK